jgi:hypothetical protein
MLFFSLHVAVLEAWTVLFAPLLSTVDREIIHRYVPTDGRATKYTYLAMPYPIFYFVASLAVIFTLVLLIVAMVILPILAVVAVGSWALAVLLLFVFWLALYRYPAFEVVLPRLRKRNLINNSYVYSQLPTDPFSIRVVRLKPGNNGDDIQCDLVIGTLDELGFEALSYVWGIALRSHTIQVNAKPFFVTSNLYSALKELRQPDRERLIWVNAMWTNQHDNAEKAVQVQSMRDIYARASRTLIWLENDTKATDSTFDLVRRLGIAAGDDLEAMWKSRNAMKSCRDIRRDLEHIFDHEWWTRAWINQEIVVSWNVVIQRGTHQVEWEPFHNLLAYLPFQRDGFDHFDAPFFAEDVQELRTEVRADEPMSNTLLGLVYRFRLQSTTFGSDKLYALLGLLKPDNPSLILPDYDKDPKDAFLRFTISCLRHNKDLRLAAGN